MEKEKERLMFEFGSDENQKMLFSILDESKIALNDKEIMEIIEEIYNKIMEVIVESKNEIKIIELNKLFIKNVITESKKYYDNNFYKNKSERKDEKLNEINNKVNEHKNNFESFEKKKPEEIDFTEKNWREDNTSVKQSIEIKIKERENDLKDICNSYKVVENEDDFKDDKKWKEKKETNKNKIFKNNKIKIENKDIKLNIDEVQIKKPLKSSIKKKVKFKDEEEDEEWKKKLIFLEKEIKEIKSLIREIVNENKLQKQKKKRY